MPFTRLIEARGIIMHGLGENAAQHEQYMDEFRKMLNQVERVYPLWLIDKGKPAAIAAEIPDTPDQREFRQLIAIRVSDLIDRALPEDKSRIPTALMVQINRLADVLTMPIQQLLEEVKNTRDMNPDIPIDSEKVA